MAIIAKLFGFGQKKPDIPTPVEPPPAAPPPAAPPPVAAPAAPDTAKASALAEAETAAKRRRLAGTASTFNAGRRGVITPMAATATKSLLGE